MVQWRWIQRMVCLMMLRMGPVCLIVMRHFQLKDTQLQYFTNILVPILFQSRNLFHQIFGTIGEILWINSDILKRLGHHHGNLRLKLHIRTEKYCFLLVLSHVNLTTNRLPTLFNIILIMTQQDMYAYEYDNIYDVVLYLCRANNLKLCTNSSTYANFK